jgi:hypothetical protein
VAIGAVAAVTFIKIVVVYYYLPYSLLLPLTGISSSLGESEEAALKIAFKNVNEKFLKNHSGIRIELIIEDT